MPLEALVVGRLPFVYGLVDPFEPEHLRYIGIATVNPYRPYIHELNAVERVGVNTYPFTWIRKLLREGRIYDVIILEELDLDTLRSEVGWHERLHILAARACGHRLTNHTDGGDGLLNPATETLAKLRTSAVARWKVPGAREAAAEKNRDAMTPAVRAKISETLSTTLLADHYICSDETRQKMSDSWTDARRTNNPLIGRIRSKEECDNISAGKLKQYENPEERRKLGEAVSQGLANRTAEQEQERIRRFQEAYHGRTPQQKQESEERRKVAFAATIAAKSRLQPASVSKGEF